MFGIYDILRFEGIYNPEKTALVDGAARYTYRQLNERINCIAYGLKEQGIGKGSPVGLLMRNEADFVTAFFALIKLGAVVNPFNFRYQINELSLLQEQVRVKYLIIGSHFEDVLAHIEELNGDNSVKIITTTPHPRHPSIAEFARCGKEDWDFTEEVGQDDIIFNVFTGGTLGTPKAASHSQQATLVRCIGYMLKHEYIGSSDVYLCYAPLFHIGGIGGMLMTLMNGGTFIILQGFDTDTIINTIEHEHATHMSLIPPTILERFREVKERRPLDLSSIKVLIMAGGSCDDSVVQLAFELMPNVKLSNGYGMSENGMYLEKSFGKDEYYADKSVILSLGKPQIFYEAKLVKENGELAGEGEHGEMFGRGPALMSGYLNRGDSFTEDGWFATGDIMWYDEHGDYHFCSRSKDMIKSGGENIYAIEVENAIILDNPAVTECAVVGLADKEWGEIVAAAVVLKDGCSMSEKEIIEHCKKSIASYKKPRKVFFIDALPRTGVGKVNKVGLKELLTQLADA